MGRHEIEAQVRRDGHRIPRPRSSRAHRDRPGRAGAGSADGADPPPGVANGLVSGVFGRKSSGRWSCELADALAMAAFPCVRTINYTDRNGAPLLPGDSGDGSAHVDARLRLERLDAVCVDLTVARRTRLPRQSWNSPVAIRTCFAQSAAGWMRADIAWSDFPARG